MNPNLVLTYRFNSMKAAGLFALSVSVCRHRRETDGSGGGFPLTGTNGAALIETRAKMLVWNGGLILSGFWQNGFNDSYAPVAEVVLACLYMVLWTPNT